VNTIHRRHGNPTTLLAVHAQMVEQNIGRPSRKMFSYTYSTTLVFTDFEVYFKNLELRPVKHAKIELDSSTSYRAAPASRSRACPACRVASDALASPHPHTGPRLSCASRGPAPQAVLKVAPLHARDGSWPCRPPADPVVP
jgi:hypothetical protein